jgi:hypothetical protein
MAEQTSQKVVVEDTIFGPTSRITAIQKLSSHIYESKKKIKKAKETKSISKKAKKYNTNMFGYEYCTLLSNAFNLVKLEEEVETGEDKKKSSEEKLKKRREYLIAEAFYNLNKFIKECKGAGAGKVEEAKEKFLKNLDPSFNGVSVDINGEKLGIRDIFNIAYKDMASFSGAYSKFGSSDMMINDKQWRTLSDIQTTNILHSEVYKEVVPKVLNVAERLKYLEHKTFLETGTKEVKDEDAALEDLYGNGEDGTKHNPVEIAKSYGGMGLAAVATVFPPLILIAAILYMIQAKKEDRNCPTNAIDETISDFIDGIFKNTKEAEKQFEGTIIDPLHTEQVKRYTDGVAEIKKDVGEFVKEGQEQIDKIGVEKASKLECADIAKMSNVGKFLLRKQMRDSDDKSTERSR